MEKDVPALIKSVKVRIIAAVVIFLLPAIISLIVNTLQNAGVVQDIASINCIFNDKAKLGKDDDAKKILSEVEKKAKKDGLEVK